MGKKLALEDIFKATEEDAQAFSELMQKSDYDAMVDGKSLDVEPPKFIYQESPTVRIQHGYHGADYVWHISAHHPRRPWKVPLRRVIYAIAQTLNQYIPSSVSVDITPPAMDWEIKEVSVKAHKIRDCWNVRNEDLEKGTHDLFRVLGTLT